MATRTISDVGGNFNSTATWVEGIVPTAADDVVATSSSGNLTVGAGSGFGYCKSLNLTGYVNILNITDTLLVSGDVTLGSQMTFIGTWYLNINANSNVTSNGIAIPYLTFSLDNMVVTLVDDMRISNGLFFQSGPPGVSLDIIINNNNIYCDKNLNHAGFSRVSGTTNIIMSGTGSFIGDAYDSILNPIIINSPSGTITIVGQMSIGGSLTYITGSIVMSGNTYLLLRFTTSSISVNFPTDKKWYSTQINPNITASFINSLSTDDLSIDNSLLNSSSIYVYRNLGSAGSNGTTEIVMAGSGSWYSGATFYRLRNNLTINTTGSFTITGSTDNTINYYGGKITYISGTVIPLTTLNILDSTTFDTSGMTWGRLNIRDGTMVLSSSLNATTMSLGYTTGTNITTNLIFTGSAGFNTKVLSVNNNAFPRNINLTPGTTYNVSNNFISSGSVTFRASSSIDRAYFNLAPTGSQNVKFTNATNIDSSGGQTIFSLGGTLINSINWSNYPSNFFLLF
jgi:hypothetical protein